LKSLLASKALATADETATWKKQGDEHLQSGRLDDAVACYRQALSTTPDHVDACVGLGFALSEQKQYAEAARPLEHALSIDPRNADAHYILGTICRNRDDSAGAIDHFTRALDVKADFAFAYRELVGALLQSGQTQNAKDVLLRAIRNHPESAEFQFHLGNLCGREGDRDGALASYQKGLSIQPDSAELHKSLADLRKQQGELDQAIAGYRKAIWFQPDFADAHLELGNVLQSQGKTDQAISCYQSAATLTPDDRGTQVSLGRLLQNMGRLEQAIECFRRAVAADPDNAAAHQFLGNALLENGAKGEAIACFEDVVRLDPDSPVRHLIAALSGGDSERAPSEYVEQLFDQYAQKFDSHLVETLSYTVPEKLAELLQPHAESSGAKWAMLDLGCGTGLSGAAVTRYARELVGVDLSSKMLEKARERNLYHRLEQLDLLTMMQREAASAYDVVFAADVFVYLGKLDELIIEVKRLLRLQGLFAFSVESLEALLDEAVGAPSRPDYQLNATGRYAHSSAYLARIAEQHGFDVLRTTGTQSRLDRGKPVQGYLNLWRSSPR